MGFLATSKIPILLTLHLYPISYNTRLNASNTTCNHPQDELQLYFYIINFTEFRFLSIFPSKISNYVLKFQKKIWTTGSKERQNCPKAKKTVNSSFKLKFSTLLNQALPVLDSNLNCNLTPISPLR